MQRWQVFALKNSIRISPPPTPSVGPARAVIPGPGPFTVLGVQLFRAQDLSPSSGRVSELRLVQLVRPQDLHCPWAEFLSSSSCSYSDPRAFHGPRAAVLWPGSRSYSGPTEATDFRIECRVGAHAPRWILEISKSVMVQWFCCFMPEVIWPQVAH